MTLEWNNNNNNGKKGDKNDWTLFNKRWPLWTPWYARATAAINRINKLRSYNLQDAGFDTVEANIKLGFKGDERDYGVGAQILRAQGVTKMKLMSNNPTKRAGLLGYGLEIVENIAIEIESNKHNEYYLQTKRDKMGHQIMKG